MFRILVISYPSNVPSSAITEIEAERFPSLGEAQAIAYDHAHYGIFCFVVKTTE